MRLIDADAVIRVLKGFRPMIPYDKELRKALGDKVEGYLEAERIIRSAPTIDAVSVVRCKDCTDMFYDDWYKCFACANLYGLNEEVKPNDYCSHGDRKTEPTISKMEQVEDEPQTCSVNGRPYDCGKCEYFRCTADEPQTERSDNERR